MKAPTLNAQNPEGIWHRKLKLDPKALFASVGKVLINLAAGRPIEAAAELPDVAASFGLSESDEDKAWLLVFRGFERAICDLLWEYYRNKTDPLECIASLSWDMLKSEKLEFEINKSFFNDPTSHPISNDLRTLAMKWLTAGGLTEVDAANLSGRMPGLLPLGLHNEWKSNSGYYASVLEKLTSPFEGAIDRQLEWSRYSATLKYAVDEPVFDESFSLKQIYVPARAFYYRKINNASKDDGSFDGEGINELRQTRQKVFWLDQEIKTWINNADIKSPIRLISGGPGSGKSSYAKMLAAAMSAEPGCRVLFVPLHLLDLDLNIGAAIEEYLKTAGYFTENPLDQRGVARPILLILDGLDELQMGGQASQAVAQQLVRDVSRLTDKMNMNSCQLLALITGRELAVQSTESQFKAEGDIIHIVPYYVQRDHHVDWEDSQDLIKIDQRDDWWRKYGALTGIGYGSIPAELKQGELGDVTAQPLLNYLVALSHRRGGIALNADTNINSVYADLLVAVYERGWAKNNHPAVEGITFDNFVRLLEEVALAVWHGAGRTATLREVEEHCKASNIANMLPGFEQGSGAGVSNLLLAFYFRQKGRRSDGEKTFEFTHKTFAEYLTARRIVRAFEQSARKMAQHSNDGDEGWDDDECLYRWLSLAGQTSLDNYVLSFVRREILIRGKARAQDLQKWGVALFSASLTKGWPMSRMQSLRFIEQTRRARNSEETLLACVNAAALVTGKLSKIKWPQKTSFGEFLKRVQGQRRGPPNVITMDCLSLLDVSGCCLDLADLYGAKLERSNLRKAELNYAILLMADLTGADLSQAVFLQTNLHRAELKGAKFSRSVFGPGGDEEALILGVPRESVDRIATMDDKVRGEPRAERERKLVQRLTKRGAEFR